MRPSRVRHYVIAAQDLEAVCDEIYETLDLAPTPKDGPDPTLAFGFRTTMMRIGTTMLEVVSPIGERHELQTFFARRGGDGGLRSSSRVPLRRLRRGRSSACATATACSSSIDASTSFPRRVVRLDCVHCL